MSAAIEGEQFVLHYQPRVDMISGEVVGAEALIRWQHPECGMVGPTEFITLAEESGQIVAIGDWVIFSACAQQAAWIAAGVATVPIAVNLSSLQFENGELLETVRDALKRNQLEPRHLVWN